jgi:hypothetical protein
MIVAVAEHSGGFELDCGIIGVKGSNGRGSLLGLQPTPADHFNPGLLEVKLRFLWIDFHGPIDVFQSLIELVLRHRNLTGKVVDLGQVSGLFQ